MIEERIVEGKFNGEEFWGDDGKIYPVSANYASKSRLVEGDVLKLIIEPDGSFIYKQIGPVPRLRIGGEIVSDGKSMGVLGQNNKFYKILSSSLTYFKARIGDDATIFIPQDGSPTWAALEHIIKKTQPGDEEL